EDRSAAGGRGWLRDGADEQSADDHANDKTCGLRQPARRLQPTLEEGLRCGSSTRPKRHQRNGGSDHHSHKVAKATVPAFGIGQALDGKGLSEDQREIICPHQGRNQLRPTQPSGDEDRASQRAYGCDKDVSARGANGDGEHYGTNGAQNGTYQKCCEGDP